MPSDPTETSSPAISGFSYGNHGGTGLNVSSDTCTHYAMGVQVGPRLYTGFPARHTSFGNFLLADGHAKFLNPLLVCPGFNAQTPTSDTNVTASGGTFAAGTGLSGPSPSTNITFAATFSAT